MANETEYLVGNNTNPEVIIEEIAVDEEDPAKKLRTYWIIAGVAVLAVTALILLIGCCCCKNSTPKKSKKKRLKTSKVRGGIPGVKATKNKGGYSISSSDTLNGDAPVLTPSNLVTRQIQPDYDAEYATYRRSHANARGRGRLHQSEEDLLASSDSYGSMERHTSYGGARPRMEGLDPYTGMPLHMADKLSISCQQLPTQGDYPTSLSSAYSYSAINAPKTSSTPKSTLAGNTALPVLLTGDTDHGLGSLTFKIYYILHKRVLLIAVRAANSLPKKDFVGTSDPYIKIALIPEKPKVSTTIKKDDPNPEWNEQFEFKNINVEKVLQRSLHLHVFDFDKYGKDNAIGEIYVELSKVGIAPLRKGVTMKRFIKPVLGHGLPRGKILLSLCFSHSTESITVGIMKCEGLMKHSKNGPESCIKVKLANKRKTQTKKQTTVINSENPVYNQVFQFKIDYSKVDDFSILIKVIDKSQRGSSRVIGYVNLGPKAGTPAVRHWNEMFRKLDQHVAEWHTVVEE